MAIALKMTTLGVRQRQRDKRQGKIGSSPAFCRWMVWGSTRTVAGNTWCYERTAEWQAVSPPPRCQSPVWLLSVCHSLTQPTHSPVPSLSPTFSVLHLSALLSVPCLSVSLSLFQSLSLSLSSFFFFVTVVQTCWPRYEAMDVCASVCENIFSVHAQCAHGRRYPPRCSTCEIHARCSSFARRAPSRKSLLSGRVLI